METHDHDDTNESPTLNDQISQAERIRAAFAYASGAMAEFAKVCRRVTEVWNRAKLDAKALDNDAQKAYNGNVE